MLGNRVMTTAEPSTIGPSPEVDPAGARQPASSNARRPARRSGRDRSWSILGSAVVVLVLAVSAATWVWIGSGGATGDSTTIDQSTLNAGGAAVGASPSTTVRSSTTASSSAGATSRQAGAALVDAARRSAAAYPDPASARAAGFRSAATLGDGGGLAVGYEVRLTEVNGAVDPAHPNGLIYRRTAAGDQPVGELFLGASGQPLAQPAPGLAIWRPTSLHTRAGDPVERLTVWFGPGVVDPFAATWAGALAG